MDDAGEREKRGKLKPRRTGERDGEKDRKGGLGRDPAHGCNSPLA